LINSTAGGRTNAIDVWSNNNSGSFRFREWDSKKPTDSYCHTAHTTFANGNSYSDIYDLPFLAGVRVQSKYPDVDACTLQHTNYAADIYNINVDAIVNYPDSQCIKDPLLRYASAQGIYYVENDGTTPVTISMKWLQRFAVKYPPESPFGALGVPVKDQVRNTRLVGSCNYVASSFDPQKLYHALYPSVAKSIADDGIPLNPALASQVIASSRWNGVSKAVDPGPISSMAAHFKTTESVPAKILGAVEHVATNAFALADRLVSSAPAQNAATLIGHRLAGPIAQRILNFLPEANPAAAAELFGGARGAGLVVDAIPMLA
jgi:hypothetical protein